MNFKPCDEMSLRHLFSTDFARTLLGLSYIGPVLNNNNSIESSPDCLILDMRTIGKPRILRCEFKYMPKGKRDFEDNKSFDIAIVWELLNCTKEELLSELHMQNGCKEVLILTETGAFKSLPEYKYDFLKNTDLFAKSLTDGSNAIKELVLKREPYAVCALYIAAKIYPKPFDLDNMVKLLKKIFPTLEKDIKPRGWANAILPFVQTKPVLLKFSNRRYYKWTDEYDSIIVATELAQLLVSNFDIRLPDQQDMKDVL